MEDSRNPKPVFRKWLYDPDDFPGECFGCYREATTTHPESNFPCCDICVDCHDLFTRAVAKARYAGKACGIKVSMKPRR